MGEVYRAVDTRLDRIVAIKVLGASVASDAGLRERFEREARTVSALNHPNICALYDLGRDRDIDYLVLEYLEGDTLAARLEKGPLPVEQAIRVAIQIAACSGQGARSGRRPSRSETGQHHPGQAGRRLDGLAAGEAARFRVGEDPPGRGASGRSHRARHGTPRIDRSWIDSRHVPIHGARAARGAGCGCADRHLRLRGSAVRNAHRSKGVRGQDAG